MILYAVINLVLPAIAAVLCALLLHEAGHYLYFRWVLKKKVVVSLGDVAGSGPRLRVGRPSDYSSHTPAQLIGVYAAGIAAGTIPLILLAVYFWPFVALLPLYALGCRRDLINIGLNLALAKHRRRKNGPRKF